MKCMLVFTVLLTMICGLCRAADAVPAGGPAPAEKSKPASHFGPALASFDYDGMPLEEVIKSLENDAPGFQVVIRSSNGGDENPSVTLHLKNVTVDQVMQVLAAKYGWGIQEVGQPPIYVIAVREQKQPEEKVSAYCVRPIVDDLVSLKDFDEESAAVLSNGTPATQSADEKRKRRAATLEEVVTTVETAMKMVANQPGPAMIQVHQPTEMIIIKASPAQRDAAEEVLRALDEGKSRVVQKDSGDLYEQARKMMEDKLQGALPRAPQNGPPVPLGFVDPNEMDSRSSLELRKLQIQEQHQLQQEIEEFRKMRERAATQPAAPQKN